MPFLLLFDTNRLYKKVFRKVLEKYIKLVRKVGGKD